VTMMSIETFLQSVFLPLVIPLAAGVMHNWFHVHLCVRGLAAIL